MEGADTRSVSVFVDSQGFVSWWSDGESSREQSWMGSSTGSGASLVVLAKVKKQLQHPHTLNGTYYGNIPF